MTDPMVIVERNATIQDFNFRFLFEWSKPRQAGTKTVYCGGYFNGEEDSTLADLVTPRMARSMLDPDLDRDIFEGLATTLHKQSGLTFLDLYDLSPMAIKMIKHHIQELNNLELRSKEEAFHKAEEANKNIIVASGYNSRR